MARRVTGDTTLQHRIEAALLKSGVALLRLLPPDTASAAMGKLWRWIAPLTRRHARALDNVAQAFPDMDRGEREALVRDMWENLGRIAAETLQLDRLVARPERFDYDVDDVRTAVGDGGAVVVGMHSGNWEVTALGGIAAGWEPVGVYQALKNPAADRLVHDLRARLYPGGLLAKGHQTARRLLTLARGGARTAMLADLRDRRGVMVPFFGRPASAGLYPAMIAIAADVPLIASRVVRLPDNRFRIEARVVAFERTGDRQVDAEAATRAFHALFESWIREYPAQWMWIMRKWS